MIEKIRKRFVVIVLSLAFAVCVCVIPACSDDNVIEGVDEPESSETTYSMDITEQVQEWEYVENNGVSYYAAEGIVYCSNPTTKTKQCLNIYIPAAYMNSDGSINASGECNGYTAETAPILYINSVGSYLGKAPYKITDSIEMTAQVNGWYYNYISEGYVLAFAGARGRSDYDYSTSPNKALGKAPVGLADLKAGIRFLKYNDEAMPGDADKIISTGTSAGGAMSILLAVSGNSTAFDSYLEEMGAVMTETDDVFAAQVYCPITDLDHADFAYEWFFKNDNSDSAQRLVSTEFEKALSEAFYDEYIEYFNGLNITVDGTSYSIEEDGRSGNFVDWLLGKYQESYYEYAELNGITGDAPTAISTIDGIVAELNGRSKSCPAFDKLDADSATAHENSVFGSRDSSFGSDDDQRHFSAPVANVIQSLIGEYDEAESYYEDYIADIQFEDLQEQVALYNPYTYLNAGDTDVAQYIRFCTGVEDSDTSPAVAAQLALTLMSRGINTEYNLIWGLGHTDADYAGAYEEWINSFCK